MPLEANKPQAAPRARVKGAALAEFLRWYVRGHGRARLDALPVAVRTALEIDPSGIGVVASTWYEAADIHALLDSIVAGLSPAERTALTVDGARATMEATLRGLYRLLFRTMMSPESYARRAQMLWDRYYDTGTMTKLAPEPGVHTTEIRDWGGHHAVLCDLHLESARFIYEAMACREVTVRRTGCTSKGAPFCAFEVRWAAGR